MSIFDETPESLGHHYASNDNRASSKVLEGDPLSLSFVFPAGESAKEVTRYLLACQQEAYHSTILDILSYNVLLADAKRCCKKYSAEQLYRAIKLSTLWCNRPFSFKFVRENALPEVIRQCPMKSGGDT